ncbi:MAG: HK97 gp10 family phage protein [Acetobacteraceae bacterium]
MAEFTLTGFARELGWLALEVEKTVPTALARAADLVAREAKREIGHYQVDAGFLPRWLRLRPRTIAEKRHLGYSPPDNPLLRTGAMRASIGYRVSAGTFEGEAEIGSNDPVALFQERGVRGRNLPARSFLARAVVRKEEEIVRLLGEAVGGAVGARRIP